MYRIRERFEHEPRVLACISFGMRALLNFNFDVLDKCALLSALPPLSYSPYPRLVPILHKFC